MSKKNNSMFDDFDKLSKKEWAKKATLELKGIDVFEKYSWQLDDFLVDPYFDITDVEKIKNHSAFNNRLLNETDPSAEPRVWINSQKIEVLKNKFESANRQALEALNAGADGIAFDLLSATDVDFKKLLKDILLPYCSISLVNASLENCIQYHTYLTNEKSPDSVNGVIILLKDSIDEQIQLLKIFEAYPDIKCLALHETVSNGYRDQIADLLMKLNNTINKLSAEGFELETIVRNLTLTASIGTDFFTEIAKIKTLRSLVFQVVRAYGQNYFQPEDLKIVCTSSAWNDEQYQPNANMLKSSTAALAAIIGGCDYLVVEPEDSASSIAVRNARNVSLILKEESYLSKVADPAAGSYYIESLIDQMSKSSWKLFQESI